MRSFQEISFRIRQELANLRLWLAPPDPVLSDTALLPLPDLASLTDLLPGTGYASTLIPFAENILRHHVPLLGIPEVDFGPVISWRRDFLHGQETSLGYFRSIPYLDFNRAGDHKLIWELNRHQHLVLLAQAYLLTQRPDFLAEIEAQIVHWLAANPLHRGINWTSALEVAFRTLSWCWIEHWIGNRLSPPLRRRFRSSLYHHACHLEHNLSVYFSPNTHLLGEAVALHTASFLFPSDRRAQRWQQLAATVVIQEMERQVRPDGSHFEQSTYYHVYALDMFLFHAILNPSVPTAYRARLERMAAYLDACLPPSGALPFFGDDDGGRFFHPYGERSRFALGSLAAAGVYFKRNEWIRSKDACLEQAVWWFGPQALSSEAPPLPSPSSQLFPGAGMAVLASKDVHALCDAGGFGAFSAGHSHSDTLSLVLTRNNQELLLDSGTCTYVSDPALRAAFRGSASHNTIRIDRLDQATQRNPFAWEDLPEVRILSWNSDSSRDLLDATCSYRGFTHRRTIFFHKPHFIAILDRLTGPPGEHLIEQFWHLPSAPHPLSETAFDIGAGTTLVLSAPASLSEGLRSRAFASREPSSVLCVRLQTELPCCLATVLSFDPPGPTPTLDWESGSVLRWNAEHPWSLHVPESGELRFIA
ncbi:MAG: alginate lyase family protein [Bryobacteraceae bacterium]